MGSAGFDPFVGHGLMGWIDPKAKRGLIDETVVPSSWRLGAIVVGMAAPMYVFSLINSPTIGGHFFGAGSLSKDVGMLFGIPYVAIMMWILVHGRRRLVRLVRELEEPGIISTDVAGSTIQETAKSNRLLAFSEGVTRLSTWREYALVGGLWLFNAINYWISFVGANRPHWSVSDANPGSLFFFLRHDVNQPNVAGIWLFCVWVPFMAWLTVLAARLFVSFACICQAVASSKSLRIIPTHPDQTGGLLPIGQASLFFSLMTLAVGLALAGFSISEFIYSKAAGQHLSANMLPLLASWIAYVVFGTMLFFLPMLPLRDRMAKERAKFLRETDGAYAKIEGEIRSELVAKKAPVELIEQQSSLTTLFESADAMAVWPYDKKTIFRFAGILGTPIAAAAAQIGPAVTDIVTKYLGI